MPESRATLRYLRTSPSKVREVLGLIRGLDVDQARDRLRFCERGAAEPVLKLLDSAVANAEHNQNLPEDELFVASAYADEGPTLKRWRARARGRGTRIRKRTSHITIVVSRFADEELARRRIEVGGRRHVRRRLPRRRAREPERAVEHEHDHEHEDKAQAEEKLAEAEDEIAEAEDAVAEAEDAVAEAEPGESVKKAPAKKQPKKDVE